MESVVKSILSDGNWGFATIPVTLVSSPITDEEKLNAGYSYKYSLPSDYIKYIKHFVNRDTGYSQNTLNRLSNGYYNYFGEDEYQIIGSFLFCNVSTLRIQYVGNVDESMYTESFILACASRLKVLIMAGFGEADADKMAFEEKKAERMIDKAKNIESKKRTNKYSIRKRLSWG